MNDALELKGDKITMNAQTHERKAMKAKPKWQDWRMLVVAGILFIHRDRQSISD